MAAKAANTGTKTSSVAFVCQVFDTETSEEVAVIPTALFGVIASETTGSAVAKFKILDGTNSSGAVLVGLVTVQEGATVVLDGPEVEVVNGGLFLEFVGSGSLDVTAYWG